MLARRVQRIGFSPTLAVSDLARQMKAAGQDVLDFSAGQPDFPTPESVKEAGRRAIAENRTRYTAAAGTLELREAIAERIRRDLGVEYGPEEILVSPGAKASLYFACLALLDPGDEVLVPSPYWTSYPEQVRLAGAVPVFLPRDESTGFRLSAEQIEEAVSQRTKALILNYPCNPTGACYDRDDLSALAEACVRHGIWVIADEIYSKLLYDDAAFTSIAQISDEVRSRTVIVDGMSKTYSMTGWRIGYAAAPREVISGMTKLQSHSTSNPTSISQWASLEALRLADSEIERRRREFEKRRDVVIEGLRGLPGVSCVLPRGAFYAFPNVSGCLAGSAGGAALEGGEDLCRFLLERAQVALVPGEAFGSRCHVRLSYAASLDQIREGLDRMARVLGELAP